MDIDICVLDIVINIESYLYYGPALINIGIVIVIAMYHHGETI